MSRQKSQLNPMPHVLVSESVIDSDQTQSFVTHFRQTTPRPTYLDVTYSPATYFYQPALPVSNTRKQLCFKRRVHARHAMLFSPCDDVIIFL